MQNLEIHAKKVYTYSVSIKVGYRQSTVSEFSQCPEVYRLWAFFVLSEMSEPH
ncbi:hypothetical protein CE91St36_16000 [Christensenellaceae bacterium]|nr:hypothetical protein CE91St36_16000 [Christensenellaceae bacterium]BDF61451.1 hypothetical protein CE91St37_16010 [Christensenellaceae bacterium]